MLDAGVRAMRMGQGRACISARESITCSLTICSLTVSLMGWWRRVGFPCFSFNEQCGRGSTTTHHAAFTLQATIDFSPMTNSEDLNNNRTVINGVQNAVIPYSCPVPFFALRPLE